MPTLADDLKQLGAKPSGSLADDLKSLGGKPKAKKPVQRTGNPQDVTDRIKKVEQFTQNTGGVVADFNYKPTQIMREPSGREVLATGLLMGANVPIKTAFKVGEGLIAKGGTKALAGKAIVKGAQISEKADAMGGAKGFAARTLHRGVTGGVENLGFDALTRPGQLFTDPNLAAQSFLFGAGMKAGIGGGIEKLGDAIEARNPTPLPKVSPAVQKAMDRYRAKQQTKSTTKPMTTEPVAQAPVNVPEAVTPEATKAVVEPVAPAVDAVQEWNDVKVGDEHYGYRVLARKIRTKAEAKRIADEQGGTVFLDGPKTWAVMKPISESLPDTPIPAQDAILTPEPVARVDTQNSTQTQVTQAGARESGMVPEQPLRMTFDEFKEKRPTFDEFLASYRPIDNEPLSYMRTLGIDGYYGKSGKRLKGSEQKAKWQNDPHADIIAQAPTKEEAHWLFKMKERRSGAKQIYDMYSELAEKSPEEIKQWQAARIREHDPVGTMFKKDNEVVAATEPTPDKPTTPVTQPDHIVEFQSGPNIAAAIKQADDLTMQTREGGSFKVDRGPDAGRDYDLRDTLLQPLGIYKPDGTPIQKGVYDRLGTVIDDNGKARDIGTPAGVAIRTAERNMTQGILTADRNIGQIASLVDSTVKPVKFGRKQLREKAFSDFIELVEKDVDDPSRMAVRDSGTPTGEALKLHDQMTESFRQYIIDSRRMQGIDTPADWGITEKGYYRHLFLGNIQLLQDGKVVGVAPTYVQAQKLAADILAADPKANIVAKARNVFNADPTLRVSTRKYFKLVKELSDEVTLSKEDIMGDLRGIVGRKGAKQKWFGALMQRKGAGGYSRAYEDVMRIHAAQAYRTQELSKLNHDLQPMVESLRKYGKPGLADAMEGHLADLWGTPTTSEKAFGKLLEQLPVIRNHVSNPALAFRGLSRKLTGLQYWLKIKGSPRAAVVNALQPFSTLWPYISTKDFAGLYADFAKPSTRKLLVDKGVLSGSTKVDGGTYTLHKRSSAVNPLNWFEKASETNRGVGYLYGYRRGLKEGMSEVDAHNFGLSWAEKVEFDNSTWNKQASLRNPAGSVLGQFKSFQLKNLENVREVMKGGKAARIGKWTGAQVGVGGVRSLGAVAKYSGGYLIVDALRNQLQNAGMGYDEAQKTAEFVYYGAPSLIGQDLSASVMILEEPYGNTPMEKAANFVLGPTVSTVVNAGSAVANKNPDKFIKSLTPSFKSYDVARQAIAGEGQSVKVGNNQYVDLSPFEAVMRGLGFTPLKQSETYDMKDAGIE
jgi:hypothetical protein